MDSERETAQENNTHEGQNCSIQIEEKERTTEDATVQKEETKEKKQENGKSEAIKEEEGNVGEKREEEENGEQEEVEEGQNGEEEDDGVQGVEERTAKKSIPKGSKEENIGDLLSPRTSESDRPTRKRKMVERFTVDVMPKGSATKPLSIEKVMGYGKYYVVFVGRRIGIYSSWEECAPEVLGFKGCIFRSYTSEKKAIKALGTFLRHQCILREEGSSSRSMSQTAVEGRNAKHSLCNQTVPMEDRPLQSDSDPTFEDGKAEDSVMIGEEEKNGSSENGGSEPATAMAYQDSGCGASFLLAMFAGFVMCLALVWVAGFLD